MPASGLSREALKILWDLQKHKMTENQKQQTLARSLIQGSLWLSVEGPRHRGVPNDKKMETNERAKH